jgi:thiamine kinase-like enzyme
MIEIQQALAGIPGFARAGVVQQLSDGPTNASLLLERKGERFVLRLDKPAARELGLNRENEQQVLTELTVAGLAPAPLYCNVSEGVLLRPYLPGRSWTEKDLKGKGSLRRLARLLRRLHAVTPTGIDFDPLGAARRYARQLATADAATVLAQAGQLAGELAHWQEAPVLCHNDPVCHNILEGKSLALIDWEYAAVGDRYFDLAVVLQHHRVDDELSRFFLDSYLGRKARADEWRHLTLQRNFYQCLLQLWNSRVVQDRT